MAIDVRTRSDADPRTADPAAVLDDRLPERLATAAGLLDGIDHLGGRRLRTLVIESEGRVWIARADPADPRRIDLRPGRPAEVAGLADHEKVVHLRVDGEQLADLLDDQVTPIGLMTAGTLDLASGQIGHLLDWWLVLRAVLDDRALHVPGTIDLPDRLDRSFTLDDDPEEIRVFLEAAGFLHLRGVFDEGEMAAISADMDRAEPTYRKDDGRSWWATLADGSERVVRMQGFDGHSETTSALLADPRFTALGGLSGCGHEHHGLPGNRVEALFKPLGVTAGISDIPWHKDCSLGRHSYECCTLTVGVSVTGAGPESGQLRVIPGSHRALIWPSLLDTTTLGLPDVPLATETGDVTVHLSCTLHMAQAPTERERRVLYTGFRLPPRDRNASDAARRRLLAASRERAPITTGQQAASR